MFKLLTDTLRTAHLQAFELFKFDSDFDILSTSYLLYVYILLHTKSDQVKSPRNIFPTPHVNK